VCGASNTGVSSFFDQGVAAFGNCAAVNRGVFMNLKDGIISAATALGFIFFSFGAQANLVLNGSFETGTSPGASYTALGTGSTAIADWSITSGSIDYIGGYWQAHDGTRSIDLDGTSAGTIRASQSIATSIGQQYLVSFWMAGNPDGTPNIKTVDVSFGSSGAQIFKFDDTGFSKTNMGWKLESFLYTATGTLSDLSNIGTLFAFALVSIGVIILRYRDPGRHRGFRAPGGIAAPVLSVLFCVLLMSGLPILTWLRFFAWLAIGLTIYFLYSRHRSEFAKR